jgi:hypothetical protein
MFPADLPERQLGRKQSTGLKAPAQGSPPRCPKLTSLCTLKTGLVPFTLHMLPLQRCGSHLLFTVEGTQLLPSKP